MLILSGRVKRGLTAAVAVISAVVLIIAVFSLVNRFLKNSNIDTVEEISVHDEFALTSILDDEWESMDTLMAMLKTPQVTTEKSVLEALRIYNERYSESVTMLVDEDGTCLRSDGVIKSMPELYESISGNDGNFAMRQDEAYRELAEAKKELLIFGKRIPNTTIDGHTFTHIVRRVKISELDSKLKLDSFGGKGFASVIDRDGYYIINMNRSASVTVRDNFLDKLKGADILGGKTYSEVLYEAGQGVSFEAVIDSVRYVIHFASLPQTNWYYVSMVPVSVFSELTGSIMGLTFALLLAIGSSIAFVAFSKTRTQRRMLEQAEGHRQELSCALARAEQASRAKTAFLNNMSHDIRTPMNAIIGFTNLAKRSAGDKGATLSYLAKIDQSSNHLLRLINDILDMSRIESGSVVLEPGDEDLSDILRSVCDILRVEIEEKDLEFSLDVCGVRNDHVVCDRLRLTQVLMNILSNAIKYTPAGGKIQLTVTQGERLADGPSLYEFRVRDNGIGMSEDFARTVFEPFTRERSSTLSGVQGTGLGMSVAKAAVDMMGGSILCRSRQGEGTLFVVKVPLKPQADRAEEAIEPSAVLGAPGELAAPAHMSVPAIKAPDFSGRRVLLAEDNELNREIALAVLEGRGLKVEWAANGREACDLLKLKRAGYFDLVLMDIQMPVMDGYAATRKIRSLDDPALARIPILAMTANAFAEDRDQALAAGMDGHLAKPLDIEALDAELWKFLS